MDLQDFIVTRLEEECVVRAFPVSWTVEKADSGAVAIAFQFAIRAKWFPKSADRPEAAWSPDWPSGYYTENRTWIIKKDGTTLNQTAIDNLVKCGLWNGDFDALGGPVASVLVLLDIGCETYEGKTRYRADWINPNADVPKTRGGFSAADPDLLAQLRQRFQPQVRAIAGGVPAGAPPAPPAAGAPDVAPVAAPVPVPVAAPAQPATVPAGAPAPAAVPVPGAAPVAAPVVAPVGLPAVAAPVAAAPAGQPVPAPAQTAPVAQGGFTPPPAHQPQAPAGPLGDDPPF